MHITILRRDVGVLARCLKQLISGRCFPGNHEAKARDKGWSSF